MDWAVVPLKFNRVEAVTDTPSTVKLPPIFVSVACANVFVSLPDKVKLP